LARSIDLHKISTEHTNEEAIAGTTSGLIGANESVTWRAKHFGVYQTLTSKITEFETPSLFVDEMVEGAFKRFRHEHHFQSIEGGHTLMRDVFDYTSPFGLLGKLADYLFLERYMRKLLEKRNEIIREFAESDQWRLVLKEEPEE
jgi:ligand-binding SRPBCC domain-containing protein